MSASVVVSLVVQGGQSREATSKFASSYALKVGLLPQPKKKKKVEREVGREVGREGVTEGSHR